MEQTHDQGNKAKPRKQLQGPNDIGGAKRHKTLVEIAPQHVVQPNQLTKWKRQLLEHSFDVFNDGTDGHKSLSEPDTKHRMRRSNS